MEIKANETEYKTLALSEDYDGHDLKFKYDISKATYEMDILQTRMLENYLRSDPVFRRAFNQNYTSEFFQALKDKARLKEPFHLSTIGQVRCLEENTEIMTYLSNGFIPIKIKDISLFIQVISYNFDLDKFEIKNAKKVYSSNKECIEIMFEDLSIIRCSLDHKFYDKDLKKVLAKKLKKGMILFFYYENLKVKSIKKIGLKRTYDLQVEDNHNYILGNGVLSKNSGKSYTSISLAVYMNALQNKRFNVNHICGNAFDFVNKLQSFPKEKLNNSTYLIDEEKQAVYGVGSIARKMKLTDVQNIIAINNISTIMLQPQNFANEDAFYGLKLFGRCFKTKTTRALLYNLQERGHGSGTPVGCVYIPIFTEFLPKYYAEALEHDYLLKKHEWVNKEMRGQGDVLGQLKKDKAREMLQDVTFCNLKSKNDKRTYLALKLGSEFTNTEIEQIVDISVLIQKGMIK